MTTVRRSRLARGAASLALVVLAASAATGCTVASIRAIWVENADDRPYYVGLAEDDGTNFAWKFVAPGTRAIAYYTSQNHPIVFGAPIPYRVSVASELCRVIDEVRSTSWKSTVRIGQGGTVLLIDGEGVGTEHLPPVEACGRPPQ